MDEFITAKRTVCHRSGSFQSFSATDPQISCIKILYCENVYYKCVKYYLENI